MGVGVVVGWVGSWVSFSIHGCFEFMMLLSVSMAVVLVGMKLRRWVGLNVDLIA